mmetsp:Transcript_26233/g.73583  ORF Transcript_26233/g.73583 Transcript_26233/m.73583 type:complete len:295 (+) Transcript_26233:149-1033(+)
MKSLGGVLMCRLTGASACTHRGNNMRLTNICQASRPCFLRRSTYKYISPLEPQLVGRTHSSTARSGTVCAASPGQEVAALEARSRQLSELRPIKLPIRGVSFDYRQSTLRSASAGQRVAFIKEPSNEYDPNAIRIELLSGQHLGYVPKEMTELFPHSLTLGNIRSLGLAGGSNSLLGAFVTVCPELPSIIPELFPSNISHPAGVRACDLSAYLSKELCRSLRDQACLASQGRCEFTGGTGDSFVEEWAHVDSSRTITLTGVKCAHASIRMVKHLPFLKGSTYSQAFSLFQELNQ